MKQGENRLSVSYDGEWIYDIVLESSYGQLLDALAPVLKGRNEKNAKICIVTDSNVAKIYKNEVEEILKSRYSTVKTFIFESGEANKNLNTIEKLYEYLIINHFERNDLLIALGGGVVGDMTGFAAATYLRGIDFVQIPTTLLAQVDSSIGGKTGVDFAQYKNMVGAFNQPKLVYMNLDVLKTLPKEQFASGMAEALKSGLIRDQEYFTYLCDEIKAIQSLEQEAILRTVSGSCKIKREVVQNDPKEKGERALLNFGHTIGHAIEKLSDFTLYHGECVALGMVAAAYISFKSGNISKEDLEKIEHIISAYNLPIRLKTAKMSADDVLAATKSDKKMEDGRVKFVLLHAIGDAYISREVSDEMLSRNPVCAAVKRKELWNDESKYRKEIVGISFDFLVRKRLFTAFRPVDEIFSLHPFKRPDSGICDRECIFSAIFRKPGSCLWDFAGAKSLFCSDHIGVFVPCILDLSLSAGRSAFLSGLCYNDAFIVRCGWKFY